MKEIHTGGMHPVLPGDTGSVPVTPTTPPHQPPGLFPHQQGWKCPSCGAGVAPWQSVCPACRPMQHPPFAY